MSFPSLMAAYAASGSAGWTRPAIASASGGTGVVEQQVQPPEGIARRGKKGSHRCGIADVGRHDERVRGLHAGLVGRLFQGS